MFGFCKKKPAPPLCPGNPGIGTEAKVAFSTGDRSWTEKLWAVASAPDGALQVDFGPGAQCPGERFLHVGLGIAEK